MFGAAHGSRALAVADFDHDGRMDVATGNELAASVTRLANVTGFVAAGFSFGSASVPSPEPVVSEASVSDRFSTVPRVETADFDHDGAIDYALPRGSIEAPRRGRRPPA